MLNLLRHTLEPHLVGTVCVCASFMTLVPCHIVLFSLTLSLISSPPFSLVNTVRENILGVSVSVPNHMTKGKWFEH